MYVEKIREVAPEFARVNVEFAFGDIYAMGKLDQRIADAFLQYLFDIVHYQPC